MARSWHAVFQVGTKFTTRCIFAEKPSTQLILMTESELEVTHSSATILINLILTEDD